MIKNNSREIPDSQLSDINELYKKGLFLQSYNKAVAIAPLKTWSGCDALIFAGKLAYQLGAPRFSRICFYRAFREFPGSLDAYVHHLNEIFRVYGPVAGWRFLRTHPVPEHHGEKDALIYFHTTKALIHGHFRDLDYAELYLKQTEEIDPDHPVLLLAKSNLLEIEDKYEEAIEPAAAVYAAYPDNINSILQYTHTLLLLDRLEDAHHILSQSIDKVESFHLYVFLMTVEIETEQFQEAMTRLDQITPFLPLMEKEIKKILLNSEISLRYLCGQYDRAIELARSVQGDSYHHFIKELSDKRSTSYVKLKVHFIRQHYKTCAPATIAAISSFWNNPIKQLDIIEAICYDGTPSYKIIEWAQKNGWYIQDFKLTWESIVEILDRKIPIGISIISMEAGHFQGIIGYDRIKKTLLIRDPFAYFTTEVNADEYLEIFKATGPRGTIILPMNKSSLIDDIELPDAHYYTLLNRIYTLLAHYDREKALEVLEELTHLSESHHVTLAAQALIAKYDGNTPTLLTILDRQLEQYPEHPFFMHQKIKCLSEIGHYKEMMKILSDYSHKKDAHPLFRTEYARILMQDKRKTSEALYWIKKSLTSMKTDAENIVLMGDLFWSDRNYEEAIELYRFASCIEDKKEAYIQKYFNASRYVKQTDRVCTYLKKRIARFGNQSINPGMSLIYAYKITEQSENALAELENQLSLHPEAGELLIFAADCYATYGNYQKAEQYLAEAKGRVLNIIWLQLAARLAGYKSEKLRAIDLWEEILTLDPLYIDAHKTLTILHAETKGKKAAYEYLNNICGKFPYQYNLQLLRILWLREEQPYMTETICRELLLQYHCNARIHSELAYSLFKQRKIEEAEKEINNAIDIDHTIPQFYVIRGDIFKYQDKQVQAMESCKQALILQVDSSEAIHRLIRCCGNPEEKKQALKFIENELIKQTIFGDGLLAFYNVALGIMDPESLLASLCMANKERPDLWYTWSLLTSHLIAMDRLDEAEKNSEKAVIHFPQIPELWLDLARVKQYTMDSEGELIALKKARDITPFHGEASRRLAFLYERKGNFKMALKILENLCTAAPLDEVNYCRLAEMYFKIGEIKEAMYKLRRAIFLNPLYKWAWQTLWEWATKEKKPDFFIEVAEKIRDERGGDPHIWVYLAESYFYGGEMQKGLQALDKALDLDPQCVQAYDVKAHYFAYIKKYPEALAACHPPGIKIIPPLLLIRKAWVMAATGNKEEAVSILKQALADAPDLEYGWILLLHYLDSLNDTGGVEEYALKMTRIFPLNTVPYGYLGTMYQKRGELAKARNVFMKAYSLSPSYYFAGTRLFTLELKNGNISMAKKILESLGNYLGSENEYYLACEAQLCLIKENPQKASAIFSQISAMPLEDPWPLTSIAGAFEEQGSGKVLYNLIDRILIANEYRIDRNRHIGPLWVKHKAERNEWFYFSKLKSVFRYTKLPTIITYILELGKVLKNNNQQRSFIQRLKFKYILLLLSSQFPIPAKVHPEACRMLGQSLLLCGLFTRAIEIVKSWNNRNKDHRTIAYVYITTLYVKGEINQAKKGTEQLLTLIKENTPPENPGDIIFSLWEQFHSLITDPRDTDGNSIHTLDYDTLSDMEKIMYNIIHFLIKKREYTEIHGKKRFISRYLKDFPRKHYMIDVIKRVAKLKSR